MKQTRTHCRTEGYDPKEIIALMPYIRGRCINFGPFLTGIMISFSTLSFFRGGRRKGRTSGLRLNEERDVILLRQERESEISKKGRKEFTIKLMNNKEDEMRGNRLE